MTDGWNEGQKDGMKDNPIFWLCLGEHHILGLTNPDVNLKIMDQLYNVSRIFTTRVSRFLLKKCLFR